MGRTSHDVIFTKHALQRLQKRRISQAAVAKAIAAPDTKEAEGDGDVVFKKVYQGRNYHVVALWLPDERRWLVKSAWVRGEEDQPVWWVGVLLAPFKLIGKLIRHERKPTHRRR